MSFGTTRTGHMGSQLLQDFLAARAPAGAIARHPKKSEIIHGSLDDEADLSRALKAARASFLVVPPSFSTQDDTQFFLRSSPARRALQAHG
ncbi:MAG TPA: hypothetical protein VMT17_06050 [Anaeromyxobacteraceae bacterium]|nr:hypothetical protein [Anaeromyxobacteraceae bacterium]